MEKFIEQNCPTCDHKLTGAKEEIKCFENAVAICTYCASMLCFDREGNLSELPMETFLSFSAQTRYQLNERVRKIVNSHL